MKWILIMSLLFGFIDQAVNQLNENNIDSFKETRDMLNKIADLFILLKNEETEMTTSSTSNRKQTGGSKKASPIYDEIKKEIKNTETAIQKFNEHRLKNTDQSIDKEELKKVIKAESNEISKAIGIAKDLVSVGTSIIDDDPLKMVTSSLNLISTVLSFTGPHGQVVSAVLTCITAGLKAFFSKTADKKSPDQIILEELKKLFKEGRNTDLEDLTNTVFTSFRTEQDFIIKHSENIDHLKVYVTKTGIKVIEELGTSLLNKFKTDIKASNCIKDCNECLSKIEQYFIISIRRQQYLLLYMALCEKILSNIAKKTKKLSKKTININFENIYNFHYDRAKLLIDIQWESDLTYLDYFIKAKRAKKCVVQYYKHPGKYLYIEGYLKTYFDKKEEINAFVTAFPDANLDGAYSYPFISEKDSFEVDFKDPKILPWVKNLKSLFVPPKHRAMLKYLSTIEIFYGPTTVNILQNNYDAIIITKNQVYSTEYIRLCNEFEMNGYCVQIDPTVENKNVGLHYLFYAKSLYIPNGWKISLETERWQRSYDRNADGLKEAWFPHSFIFNDLQGPIQLDYFCEKGNYNFKKIIDVSKSDTPKNKIKLCKEKNFSGYCDYFGVNSEQAIEINSCRWDKIGSFSVPENMLFKITDGNGNLKGPFFETNSDAGIEKVKGIRFETLNHKWKKSLE